MSPSLSPGRQTLELLASTAGTGPCEGEGRSGNTIKLADSHETDVNIEIWKVKMLIKAIDAANENLTIMISLIIPPSDQISRVTKMLGDEYETVTKDESMVDRQSVLATIISVQRKLEQYNQVPPNGLVLYTGTIVSDEGKEKEEIYEFEPFRPIKSFFYLRDNKFHTEALNELLEYKFGFIVVGTRGTLFGTLSGNTKEVLHSFYVDLPNRQPSHFFARLHREEHHKYVRNAAELATQFFINSVTGKPNVYGLILAGSADLKTELSQHDIFDQRLAFKILGVVDIICDGTDGFDQAIARSAGVLSSAKVIQEEKLLEKYFEQINKENYVIGVDDTIAALELSAVETLIVWEDLKIYRFILKNSATGEILIKHLNKAQEANRSNFIDEATSTELEVLEKTLLTNWFLKNYEQFGCCIEFVPGKSAKGIQFRKGLHGLGGIIRWLS